MYTISIPGQSFDLATLVEAFSLLWKDSRLSALDTGDIQLSHDGEPLCVTRYNGQLTLRLPGTAASIFSSLFGELHRTWFVQDNLQLHLWQARPQHWDLFQFVFELARKPAWMLSSNQLEAEVEAAAARGERFSLAAVCEAAALRWFGYGASGPRIQATGYVNGRHEVHVACALALNLPVPEAVLGAYRESDARFQYDLGWAKVLLDTPSLRGRVSIPKLKIAASIMRTDRLSITPANADALLAALDQVPDDPTFAQVDNALFAAGEVGQMQLPEYFDKPVDIGTPVSEVAVRLRQLNADDRRDKALRRADAELASGQIGRRKHALDRAVAMLAHGR